ncbi:LysR family transcriptional regulator [Occultella glacieicola]|uniref:LysR family transcriptional regulator n=1 Tax=Occultella glacieicola TaxID=2518684 RepID=A0ABY2E0V1_9MICO|nr:LysR substrate-binding domain-containing protein [Occultella glacieicola]TDE91562.1 LysR family transcriptional regulator [Occultella glacieicola]
MYTLDQLRGFVAVAEERNFSRAADRLGMTQPPLSRLVRKLEGELRVELFARTHRGAQLTTAGRVFLDEARRILGLAEAAPLRARGVAAGTAGTVRIGFTAMTALTVLGGWARAVGEHLPGVDLILTEMVTADQVEAVLAGQIDVGLARGVNPSEILAARLVHSEPLVLAVPAGHPLTRLGRPPVLADVAEHHIVTYAPVEARYLYEVVVAAFSDAGLTPHYVQHVSQVHSVLALVDAGVGVGLVPTSATALRLPSLTYLEPSGLAERKVQAQCVWRRDNTNPALKQVLLLGEGHWRVARARR